ncbi:MAG: hypothetical protein OXF93_23925 [Acidobacteria bacterium]|nr:hypothetical protein [Acidobacteriota bacterium]
MTRDDRTDLLLLRLAAMVTVGGAFVGWGRLAARQAAASAR